MPEGVEDLADEADIAEGLAELKRRDPNLKRAVVKLNEGFSGEGNALFRFDDAPSGKGLAAWIRARLPKLAFEARDMTWDAYLAKARQMGAIVEAFIEGEEKRSPSAQFRIDPLGACGGRIDPRSGARRPERPGVSGLPLPGGRGLSAGDPVRRREGRRRARAPGRDGAASASISFPSARPGPGSITPSRSTCAKAARPIRS